MPKQYEIAVAGFLHETNTFVPRKADLAAFRAGNGFPKLSVDNEVPAALKGVNLALAGFLDEAPRSWTLRPMIFATAIPSGVVTTEVFELVSAHIDRCLDTHQNLDAIYLDLHGAMVTELHDDGEGELLERVRARTGDKLPIIVSLDLHANVSPAMFDRADMLVSYRTYPHIDMAETGKRCARYLGEILESGNRPAKALRQLPFLIPTVAQCSEMEPNASIYARLSALEEAGVLSASFNPGFPASDVPECWPSLTVYGFDANQVDAAADELQRHIGNKEGEFAFPLYAPDAAVEYAQAAGADRRPVIIADTQDNPGGGGSSDTTGLLRALVEADAQDAAIGLIVDPEAAKAVHAAGLNAEIELDLGGKSGVAGDAPFSGTFRVDNLSDGKIRMKGKFYGDSAADLGLSACISIGGVRVVLASNIVQMADLEMFRFVGIDPEDMDILAVKSTVHFRADFAPIAGEIIVARSPGAMIADIAALPWHNLKDGTRLGPNGPAFKR